MIVLFDIHAIYFPPTAGAVASVNPVITRMFVCSYVCSTGTLTVPAKVINMMTSVQERQMDRGDPCRRVAHLYYSVVL